MACVFGGGYRTGIFKKSMGARYGVGIGLLYRPARHRLAEFIPWNRFRGPIHVQKYQLRVYVSVPTCMPQGTGRREIIVRGQSYFSRLPIYWPHPPLRPASLSSPRGVLHTRRAERGMGVNILEDERNRIALLQWSRYGTGARNQGRHPNLEQSMWARNLVGIGLTYPPARLLRLTESIP